MERIFCAIALLAGIYVTAAHSPKAAKFIGERYLAPPSAESDEIDRILETTSWKEVTPYLLANGGPQLVIEKGIDSMESAISGTSPQDGVMAVIEEELNKHPRGRKQLKRLVKQTQKRTGFKGTSLGALTRDSQRSTRDHVIQESLLKIAGALALIQANRVPPSEFDDPQNNYGRFYARQFLEKLYALTQSDNLKESPDVLASLQSLLEDPQHFIASQSFRAKGVLLLWNGSLINIGGDMNPFTIHNTTKQIHQFLLNDQPAAEALMMGFDRFVQTAEFDPDQYEKFADGLGEVVSRLPVELQKQFQSRSAITALLRKNQERTLAGVSTNQRLRERESTVTGWLETLSEIAVTPDGTKARTLAGTIEKLPNSRQVFELFILSLQPDTQPIVTTPSFYPPDPAASRQCLAAFKDQVWPHLNESAQRKLGTLAYLAEHQEIPEEDSTTRASL